MKKNYIIIAVFTFILLFTSCTKKTEEEKLYIKLEKIYNKKGLKKFTAKVNKTKYLPVKDFQNDNATPLLIAASNNETDFVSIYINNGADIFSEKDDNGKDILDYALKSNNSDCLETIVKLLPHEYWNLSDTKGNLPVIRLFENTNSYFSILEAISQTEDLERKNVNNKSILMYAAQNNIDVRILKMILDKFVDINEKNDNEWTALMYAARYNPNPAILSNLLLRGAHSSPNSVGLTITMLAACNPNPGVLLISLSQLSELNAQTNNGKTALMYACENQQSAESIDLLLNNGADLNIKDKDGKTALIYALENYTKPEVIYLLLTAGADPTIVDKNDKNISDYLQQNNNLNKTDLIKFINISSTNEKKQTNSIVDENKAQDDINMLNNIDYEDDNDNEKINLGE